MLILKTTDQLRFELTSAVTTQLIFTSSYVDITGFAPSNNSGISDNTNHVVLVGSPVAGVRQIKGVSIFNSNSAIAGVKVELWNGVDADRYILSITLQVGDTLHYSDTDLWFVTDANGFRKVSTNVANLYSALTTNAYITYTYDQTTNTITGVPIADTTVQKTEYAKNNNLISTRRKLNLISTEDFVWEVTDDTINNKTDVRLQDNFYKNLVRALLFELTVQGFKINDPILLNELSQYQVQERNSANRRP